VELAYTRDLKSLAEKLAGSSPAFRICEYTKGVNMGWLRYKVKLWIDPYNEQGQYKVLEASFANKAEALQFAQRPGYGRACVIDLLGDNEILFWKET
jgi:hypothetical protein